MQLEIPNELLPCAESLRTLDKLCIDLSTCRAEVGRAIGVVDCVVLWAFVRGQSPRAKEVRRAALKHLRTLVKKQTRELVEAL